MNRRAPLRSHPRPPKLRPHQAPPPKASSSKSAVMKTMVEAMLLAVTQVGEDGRGKDGLNGYLRAIARADPKAFLSLFGRLLVSPSQFEPETQPLTHEG